MESTAELRDYKFPLCQATLKLADLPVASVVDKSESPWWDK